MSDAIALNDLAGTGLQVAAGLNKVLGTSEISLAVPTAATSQKVVIGVASVASAAINAQVALVTVDVDCFCRAGATPVAVSDGTDMILLAGNTYRVLITPGFALAFITAGGAGNVYITPGV